MANGISGNDIREIVLQMLTEVFEDGQFSHVVRNRTFAAVSMSRQERVFAGRLFHGVLEESLYLDWIISSYSSVKIHKMKPAIRNILRMSIYQMLFMDAVPDHAAINEAVRLTKKKGYRGLVPFVNGLLRSFQRSGVKPGMPEHVKSSVPRWLFELEVRELGHKKALAFFDAVRKPGENLFVRMVLSKASAEIIMDLLKEDGCEAERVPEMKEALLLKSAGNLSQLRAFQKGLIVVQDLSSMHVGWYAAELSGRNSGIEDGGCTPAKERTACGKAESSGEDVRRTDVRRILDVCAAPGGKSLHLAELFPEAEVTARDLSEAKVTMIGENIKRCGLSNVRAEVHDALVSDESLKEDFDIVLADLPCSGLGVIGRKPDIKLRVKEADLTELAGLQRKILSVVWQYVRPGGLLIYSTCTVNRAENQENAAWFAAEFPFEMILERLFVPGFDDGDGFYIACFRRL